MREGRFYSFLIAGGIVLLLFWVLSNLFGHTRQSVFEPSVNSGYKVVSSNSGTPSGSAASRASESKSVVPWDYKIDEGKVGDLLDGDMTILPNNQLLPNDENYATGDSVWVLSYMNAEMDTSPDGKTKVTLSAWKPIKTYKTKEEADQAIGNLKDEVKTDVQLVGVYKTEYQGKTREFAVLTLPSGNQIKQPVNDQRYAAIKNEKTVKVVLEEVHDYVNYDSAMAKFRGWAD